MRQGGRWFFSTCTVQGFLLGMPAWGVCGAVQGFFGGGTSTLGGVELLRCQPVFLLG